MVEKEFNRELCDERHDQQDKKIEMLFAKYEAMGCKLDRINSLLIANLFSMLTGFVVGIGMYLVKQ